MKYLIVTADDFGLADEVNRAVEIAHREGVLTAASLMVGAPAAADAVETARRLPGLAVGLHLALVDAEPVLPASAVPDLVDDRGRFRTDMARSGAAMFFLPRVRRQMLAEVRAQFEAFRATGLKLDHVTSHKHFHLHPSVTSAILDLRAEFGVGAVRAPAEPGSVLARIEGGSPGLATAALGPLARLQRRRLRQAGIAAPDQVFGLGWSGAMTPSRLTGLIAKLPDGVSEIYAHPATAPGFAGAAPGYRYREEFAALASPELRRQIAAAGIASGGFAGAVNFRNHEQARRRGLMAVSQMELALGAAAPDFRLPATDGRPYALKDVAGAKGTVVVFICNHCPYVKAVIGRLVADARALMAEGVGLAAICSNDAASYPEDSFPRMREFATKHDFPFPYLHDESQSVARAYGAVCTPDFFGFDRDLKLGYRGRLDEGRTTPPPANARRELVDAMRTIAAGGEAPANQVPSIGCSIKWKAGRG